MDDDTKQMMFDFASVIIPAFIRYTPAAINMIRQIREAPDEISDEELAARWTENSLRVGGSIARWRETPSPNVAEAP